MDVPKQHRSLYDQLVAVLGKKAANERLALLGLETLASTRDLAGVLNSDAQLPRREPSPFEILEAKLADVGLKLLDYSPGRPNVATFAAAGADVVIGEPDVEQVRVGPMAVRATVGVLTQRSTSGNALFSVSLKELRKRDRLRPHGTPVAMFVLKSEERVWVVTRGELEAVHEELAHGTRVERFSLGGRELLVRVALPKRPTFDLAFPRVAPAPEEA